MNESLSLIDAIFLKCYLKIKQNFSRSVLPVTNDDNLTDLVYEQIKLI